MFAILFVIFIIICIVIVACKCSASPVTDLSIESMEELVVRPKGCKSCQPEKKSCATGLCSKKFGCGN